MKGPIGVSSTRGTRVPEERRRVVYVRMWTFGRFLTESESDVDVVPFDEGGVGESETLMTCSRPGRQIESITSALKKSINRDLSWMNRGWVSNSSEAKCIIGLCPGVDFGVCRPKFIRQ